MPLDDDAVEAIYREHGPMLRRVVWRATTDVDRVDDIVQETILRVWRQAPEADNLRAYLITTARHLIVDQHRAAGRRPQQARLVDLPETESGGIPARILGGPALLDPRPFRLARLAGVACRPAFATQPRGGWTLTLGPRLSGNPEACAEEFGRVFARVAAGAPLDIDGVVYTHRARGAGR